MQAFSFFRRHLNPTVVIGLTLVAVITPACQGGSNLPDKSSKEYREYVSAFYVGLAALDVGDDVRAEERLKRATEVVPGEPAAWGNLGLLALRQREFDVAAERLERARTLAPDNAAIYSLRGLLESSRGQSAEAIRNLRRATELNPKDLRATYSLAQEIEREGGENSEAEVLGIYEKILETEPSNLAVLLEVARLAAKRGDVERFRQTVARIAEQSATWPPEVREQLVALQTAAAGPNPRQAASRVAFLRNVLLRVAEYRQSLLAVKLPADILGEPLTRFVLLPSPDFTPAPPDEAVTFATEPLSGAEANKWTWVGYVSLNGEESPVMVLANNSEVRVGERATLMFPGGAASTPPAPDGIAAMDYNYDFKTDLVLAGAGGVRIYKQESPGAFTDATTRAALPAEVANARYTGAWPADVELDGDLDIVLGAEEGTPVVLRNNGDETFKAVRPFEGANNLRAFAWADVDEDGDPDAVLVDAQGRLQVFANERTGQFRARAVPQTLGQIVAVAIADANSDGRLDVLVLQADGAIRRLSDKADGANWEVDEVGRWSDAGNLNVSTARLWAADFDNNGGIDLAASSANASRVWLSGVDGKFNPLGASIAGRVLDVAEVTGDGRLDFAALTEGGQAARFVNRGTKDYHWQIIRTRAANAVGDQRINSFGVGGEMEIRSGLLAQKQIINGPLVHFGLGEQTTADVVRIVWPNGSVRAEFDLKADQTVLAEQRLKGSCPHLFADDGTGIKFVKDCAPWSPALGLRINAQDTMGILQTEEWMKIRGDQLKPKDGFYDLRITAELWETFYIDHYSLMVVDHPAGTEIFADERFAVPPPPLTVYAVAPPQSFARARDDTGQDVSDIVRALDQRYLDTFGRGSHQGVTREHFVELELSDDAPVDGPLWLIAHGWLHPTDGSINVAIGQGTRTPPHGLSLEVPDSNGEWVVAKPGLGFPAGKNKTIMIDLAGIFRPNAPRRVRLRTNMEIFWDKLEWAAGVPEAQMKTERLSPASAELRYRGFSVMNKADESSPELPEYKIATTTQRWRDLIGYYTRYGDIRDLVTKVDDRIVLVNAGDEMRFRFAAPPPPPAGWVRDFVLVGDGWIKDGDYNSSFSKTVLPLPTHTGTDYTREPTRLEDDPVYQRFPQDWQDYHTRYVTPESFRNALRRNGKN